MSEKSVEKCHAIKKLKVSVKTFLISINFLTSMRFLSFNNMNSKNQQIRTNTLKPGNF